jgi:hypothetical protein
MTKRKRNRKPKSTDSSGPRCGLCGKRGKLTKTDCCGQFICDDADQYELFSYAGNSCWRNHDRYTLCGSHHNEGHDGDWRNCLQCRENFETEMYVWYGTNEFNFEKLDNPPDYEPTKCSKCGAIIVLSEGGFSCLGRSYLCQACTAKEFQDLL